MNQSGPPDGANPNPVGTNHTHPAGTGANSSDHMNWHGRRAQSEGKTVDTIIMIGENCCENDPNKYGVAVEVWIWTESDKLPTGGINIRPTSPYMKAYNACLDGGGSQRQCTRQGSAAAADYLKDKGILEDYFVFQMCCEF
jgi:hypothetical protein